jgi:hypothetical protein
MGPQHLKGHREDDKQAHQIVNDSRVIVVFISVVMTTGMITVALLYKNKQY